MMPWYPVCLENRKKNFPTCYTLRVSNNSSILMHQTISYSFLNETIGKVPNIYFSIRFIMKNEMNASYLITYYLIFRICSKIFEENWKWGYAAWIFTKFISIDSFLIPKNNQIKKKLKKSLFHDSIVEIKLGLIIFRKKKGSIFSIL